MKASRSPGKHMSAQSSEHVLELPHATSTSFVVSDRCRNGPGGIGIAIGEIECVFITLAVVFAGATDSCLPAVSLRSRLA